MDSPLDNVVTHCIAIQSPLLLSTLGDGATGRPARLAIGHGAHRWGEWKTLALWLVQDIIALAHTVTLEITMGALQMHRVRVGGLTWVLFIFVHLLSRDQAFPESGDN